MVKPTNNDVKSNPIDGISLTCIVEKVGTKEAKQVQVVTNPPGITIYFIRNFATFVAEKVFYDEDGEAYSWEEIPGFQVI